jgi:ketosteroid isomerase-like protein
VSELLADATAVMHAFARSDLAEIDRLCAEDVLVIGTDTGEHWRGKAALLESFAGAFDLSVRWLAPPTLGEEWVAGSLEFDQGAAGLQPARVTMVFRQGLLVHAHYSIAAGT